MTPELLMVAVAGTVAGAVAFLYLAVRSLKKRARAGQQLPRETTEARELAAIEAAGGGGAKGFRRLGAAFRPGEEKALGQLRNRLVQAGLYGRDAVDLYLSVRMSVFIAGLLIFIVMSRALSSLTAVIFLGMIIGTLCVLAPSIWLDMRTSKRKIEVSKTLPGTLDLLVTCLDAGLNLEQALTRVATETRFGDDLLSRELRITLEEIRAGLSTSVAFQRLASRLGHDEVQNLSALIAQASALGANLGDALRAHSQTMRTHRIVFLEEQAGKANAKLTLPLTMCLLPAVMILLLGPAVFMIMKSY